MRRDDICLYLGPADRAELQALLTNRNTARKLVWRAEIVPATADGHGTFEIMRRARTSKPTVWRWQQRYLDAGVEGLKRDRTRPSRVPPLPMKTRLKVIAKTVQETPPNATHWTRTLMAEAVGISPSSVGRIWAEAGLKPHITKGFKGLCCTNPIRDSPCESSVVAGGHEQTHTPHLQDQELARL